MIKVKYNSETTLVEGYFPNTIHYKNIDKKAFTIDDSPYMEITAQEHRANLDKTMCVVDGSYQEYIKTNDELLEEAKKAKCAEICVLRNQKIKEDSVRYSQANIAENAVNALTTITKVENYDINTEFGA